MKLGTIFSVVTHCWQRYEKMILSTFGTLWKEEVAAKFVSKIPTKVLNQATIRPLGVQLPDSSHRHMCKDSHSVLSVIEKDWKPLVPITRRRGPGNTVRVDWVLCKGHAETECKRLTKTTPTKEKEKRRNWAERPLKPSVDLLFWNQQKLLSREIVSLTADTYSATGWSACRSEEHAGAPQLNSERFISFGPSAPHSL